MGRSTPTHAPENQHLVELTVDEAKVMIIDLQEAVTEKDIVIHDLEDAKRDKDDEIAQLQNTIAQLLGPKPPDHHYGWVIVMCTFILQFTVLGYGNPLSLLKAKISYDTKSKNSSQRLGNLTIPFSSKWLPSEVACIDTYSLLTNTFFFFAFHS